MKAAKFFGLFFSGLLLSQAQVSLPSHSLNALTSVLTAKQTALTNSQALFASKNFIAAEAALEAANFRPAGTPEWHSESAGELLQAAFLFKAQGDAQTMLQIVQLALNQFGLAEQGYNGTTVAAELVNEKTNLGYLYEHVLGDRTKAQQYYSQAVSLSSKSGLAAQYLARLNRSLAEEAKKPGRATAP